MHARLLTALPLAALPSLPGLGTGARVATGPDRRRDAVVDRPAGCSSQTVRKVDEGGDSRTVRTERCD